MNYVAGFMYSQNGKEVALIIKLKPEWQRGKLNGIGGKIEEGESPDNAMMREFEEETGFWTNGWRCFCVLKGDFGKVYFYTNKGDLSKLKSMEEEQVEIHDTHEIVNLTTVPNLLWLVPMGICQGNVAGVIEENSHLLGITHGVDD